MAVFRWLSEVTIPAVFMTVSDCVCRRVATLAVLSLPLVAEITVTVCTKSLEIFGLRKLQRSGIVSHAHLGAWYCVHNSSIKKVELARVCGRGDVKGAYRCLSIAMWYR